MDGMDPYREPHTMTAIITGRRGRNGFDGIESLWEGVPGSELPLNDRKTRTANQQFAYAA